MEHRKLLGVLLRPCVGVLVTRCGKVAYHVLDS